MRHATGPGCYRPAIVEQRIEAADGRLGEEGLDRPGETGWQWIIDPLDGTVNYLYGNDEWAVSMAVRDDAGTVAGVVHAPALGRTYTAMRGEGCCLDGRRVTVRRCRGLSHAVVGTGFSYDAATRAAQAAVYARVLPQVADIRRCGSAALGLARVASGRLDAFYEKDLQEWDCSRNPHRTRSRRDRRNHVPAPTTAPASSPPPSACSTPSRRSSKIRLKPAPSANSRRRTPPGAPRAPQSSWECQSVAGEACHTVWSSQRLPVSQLVSDAKRQA